MPRIAMKAIWVFLFFLSGGVQASYEEYLKSLRSPSFSDYGTIGLIHMPSARMMPEGSLAFKWARGQPYFRGSIVATPFSRWEALYKYTDINDQLYSADKNFSGGQSLKDKAFDTKFILKWETRLLPQIAIGVRDFGGTDRFAAEYIVASKYYKNLDITFGLGWGTLAGTKSIENPLAKLAERFEVRGQSGRVGTGGGLSPDQWFSGSHASYFGGVEYFFPQKRGMTFKLEYDPTDYMREGDRNEPLEQTSKINFGFNYPLTSNFNLSLGWVRGNTLSIGFSFKGSYSQKDPLRLKSKTKKIVPQKDLLKKINTRNKNAYYLSSLKYLNEESLFLQSADVKDNEMHIVYTQAKHQSYIRAAGRAASVLEQISPDEITTFTFSSMNAGIIMNTVSIPRDTFTQNELTNSYQEVKYLSSVDKNPNNLNLEDFEFRPKAKFPVHSLKFTPALRNHIGGPDGFYFGEAFLRASQNIILTRNLSINALYSISLVDNFDTLKLESDSVLPHVRTDVIKYLKGGRGFSITRLQLDYIVEPLNDLYFKLSGGLHEEMFGGIGGEVLYRPFDSNHALGFDFSKVKQRDYSQLFEFQDYSILTGHLNYYFHHPASKVLFTMKGGRFLAGDSGIKFDFSRRFKSGMYMGAYFTRTDISKEEFGEGSFDKGFYFSFPLEIFFKEHSRARSYFGLRPLTRDGGAKLIRAYELYGVTDMGSYNALDRDWDDIYD
ncbi:YjbH domain-containing protein [Gammaproteobacteria bacterium]|jgi:hypothetical protein|nr:YjbH domain-containing protein [Gammaproteobacteria bacterium]